MWNAKLFYDFMMFWYKTYKREFHIRGHITMRQDI